MLLIISSWITFMTSTVVLIRLLDICMEQGAVATLKTVAGFLVTLPGVRRLVKAFTQREVKGFMKDTFDKNNQEKTKIIEIPKEGIPIEELRKELDSLKSGHEKLVSEGRLFAYVYTAEGPRLQLQKEAFNMFTKMSLRGVNEEHTGIVEAYLESFMHDNALNPLVFPSLRKFENEVVAMTANMLHGDGYVVGSVTSGGTESILMAMKTYRDMARDLKSKITEPNVVAPVTIHPAFEKAAHYFNLKMKHVPVSQSTFQCDLAEYERAIDSNTILLLASAPSYPQAILDPVQGISQIALRRKLAFHVDACFGGFMLPWVEKLGYEIPLWDYRLQGVTSITADLHKYGFATKGASVVTYRHSSIRKYQFFAYSGWSGGLFASPTMAGTRPGGHLAGAWVALRAMGQNGYTEMAQQLMDTANKMRDRINQIDGLKVLGKPLMTAYGFGSSDKKVNIFAVADIMEKNDLVKPYNLSISSYNLNARLRWNFKVKYGSSSSVRDIKNDTTFTVMFYSFSEELQKHRWSPMPNCIQIKELFCNLSGLYVFSNFYHVRAQVRNGTSVPSKTLEYDPSLCEHLHPPPFQLSFAGSNIVIDIANPARVYWADEFLYDFLSNFNLEYEIEYWIMDGTNGKTNQHTTTKPPDVVAIRFPVQRNASDTVCVRMRLQGEIDFSPGIWSKPVCISEMKNNHYVAGKIVAICVGCLAALIAVIVALNYTMKRYKKLKQAINSPLPCELQKIVSDMNRNYPEIFSDDVEPENPSAYYPHKSNVNGDSDKYSPMSDGLDKLHLPITNNNYVTSLPERVSKFRLPNLDSTPSSDGVADSDDITDYVGIPSPDSGLGIRMDFSV